MELALTGDTITAERGYELGPRRPPGRARRGGRCGAGARAAPSRATARSRSIATKAILEQQIDWGDEEFWQRQGEISGPVFASEDAREGAVAFSEKRDPVWQGR